MIIDSIMQLYAPNGPSFLASGKDEVEIWHDGMTKFAIFSNLVLIMEEGVAYNGENTPSDELLSRVERMRSMPSYHSTTVSHEMLKRQVVFGASPDYKITIEGCTYQIQSQFMYLLTDLGDLDLGDIEIDGGGIELLGLNGVVVFNPIRFSWSTPEITGTMIVRPLNPTGEPRGKLLKMMQEHSSSAVDISKYGFKKVGT